MYLLTYLFTYQLRLVDCTLPLHCCRDGLFHLSIDRSIINQSIIRINQFYLYLFIFYSRLGIDCLINYSTWLSKQMILKFAAIIQRN